MSTQLLLLESCAESCADPGLEQQSSRVSLDSLVSFDK